MLQSPFFELSTFRIYARYLLKLGVESTPIMIIVRLSFLPSSLVGQHHQLYSGTGADIVMESISRIDAQ